MQALRILLVEDNATDRALVRRIIATRSDLVATIDEAATATEAIGMLSRARFDAAIVDLHLIGKASGAEVLGALAELQPDCKRILVSGSLFSIVASDRNFAGAALVPKTANLVADLQAALENVAV